MALYRPTDPDPTEGRQAFITVFLIIDKNFT